MVIFLKKFGDTLTSRQLGQEAFSAIRPTVSKVPEDEEIEIDFEGVDVLTPSWADEFLTLLREEFGDRVVLRDNGNTLGQEVLEFLEEIKEEQ